MKNSPFPALPNIPWEEPANLQDVLWRYNANPIIPRDLLPDSNSIFNSAVVPFEDGFRGVFRCDNTKREMNLHTGWSKDGFNWQLEKKPIQWILDNPDIYPFRYQYDPRIVWVEDRYYIIWCNDMRGPTIGLGYTFDFKDFHMLENVLLPYNRNGVLFPRKVKGKYLLLSRPSDTGHTPFGDMFISQSEDMIHWGEHRFVMGTSAGWQSTKIGAGPAPIETPEGWLLFYHGVLTSCNGFVYSIGAALLDLEKPWKVLYRSAPYLLSPQTLYECVGDTPNVAFPCAALVDPPTGRIAIYYGGADTVTALAFTTLDKVISFVKNNSEV